MALTVRAALPTPGTADSPGPHGGGGGPHGPGVPPPGPADSSTPKGGDRLGESFGISALRPAKPYLPYLSHNLTFDACEECIYRERCNTSVRNYKRIYIQICIYTGSMYIMYIYIYMYTMNMHMYRYICICVHICIYIYIYHTHLCYTYIHIFV